MKLINTNVENVHAAICYLYNRENVIGKFPVTLILFYTARCKYLVQNVKWRSNAKIIFKSKFNCFDQISTGIFDVIGSEKVEYF